MKTFIRIFILLMFANMVLPGFAQFGSIVVFAPKGEKFTLFIGSKSKNSEPESRVEADNPGGPSFKLKVVFPDPAIKEASKMVFNKPHGTMYFSVVKNNKGVYVLESTSSEWSDEPAAKQTPPPAAAETDKKENAASETAAATTGTGEGKPGCENPMSTGDFAVALAGIASYPFEGSQLNAAKKMAETHCLFVMQVREVMYVFDLESSRLSFAKFAYDHTYDLENYTEVSEALNSKKSKDDLAKFLAGKKK